MAATSTDTNASRQMQYTLGRNEVALRALPREHQVTMRARLDATQAAAMLVERERLAGMLAWYEAGSDVGRKPTSAEVLAYVRALLRTDY